jgi:medium-chain acyl-[acyl-carrier-protein] hydrolase
METYSRWLVRTKLSAQDELRLFCFPYAGGSAAMYLRWGERLPKQITVCPVELPGRGKRFGEPCHRDLATLVAELAADLRPNLDRPFAFFGHSMGALISFELARQLTWAHRLPPTHLLLSAHRAPQLPRTTAARYTLPDQRLLGLLRELGGVSQEILQQPEILQRALPILRADFELCDTYVYRAGTPLPCPITVFGGSADPVVRPHQLNGWHSQTSAAFRLHLLDGAHFYLNTAQPDLLTLLAQQVQATPAHRLPNSRSEYEPAYSLCA